MKQSAKIIPWSEFTPRVTQVARSTAPPGSVIPRKWFRDHIVDFDLWLVCAGRVELIDSQNHATPLSRGSVVWLRPGCDFELRVDESGPYTNAYVHFDFYDENQRLIPPQNIATPPTFGYTEDMHYFDATLRRMMYLHYQQERGQEAGPSALHDQVSRLLCGLLHDYELGHRPGPPANEASSEPHAQMISSALSWIYLHPQSGGSAAGLARQFGYSQRHFCRIFRQFTGKTPGQALIESRIDHAKKLLATSALNVSEIADSLHYESVFYFSRQFKQLTGLAPAAFRRASQHA